MHSSLPAVPPGPYVIVGCGGHGREVLWALSSMLSAVGRGSEVLGFIDDAAPPVQLIERLQSNYLGVLAELSGMDVRVTFGIGAPSTRAAVVERVSGFGCKLADVAHPSVLIGPDVEWGPGLVACANVSVTTNVRFGAHVHLNRHVTVGHDCTIDDFVSLHPGAIVSGNVRIGARTMVGAGAVLLPGVTVGSDVQVGAGAVVTRDIPDGQTVAGAPARSIA